MNAKELISQWHSGLRMFQIAHSRAATLNEKLNRGFGIPVVILSTVVGTSIFATLQDEANLYVKIFVGLLSISAAAFSSLQTFLRFAEMSEQHKTAATKYGELRRELEAYSIFPHADPTALKDYLDGFRIRWDAIEKESPPLLQSTHDEAMAYLHREEAAGSANEHVNRGQKTSAWLRKRSPA